MRRSLALTSIGAALVAPRIVFAQTATAAPMRLASLPFDAGSEIFYATELGLFAKNGIDAKVQAMQSGPAVAAAIASGALEAGFSNAVSIAAAAKRGIPLVFIAPAAIYQSAAPSSVLMVKADSPIHSGKDLIGKTVGTNGLKNIGQYAPALWIDKTGGDSSTVKFVEIPPAEDYAAIDSGRIDACNVAEPQITEMKPIARILAKPYDTLGEGWMIAGWFANRNWAEKNPDTVLRFQATMRETAVWANHNHEKSADLLAKWTQLDAKLIRSGVRATFAEGALTPQMVQPSIDLAARYKLFDGAFPAADIIFQPKR
jgi:NitT/TauT family transport system substrate-binding protein